MEENFREACIDIQIDWMLDQRKSRKARLKENKTIRKYFPLFKGLRAGLPTNLDMWNRDLQELNIMKSIREMKLCIGDFRLKLAHGYQLGSRICAIRTSMAALEL